MNKDTLLAMSAFAPCSLSFVLCSLVILKNENNLYRLELSAA